VGVEASLLRFGPPVNTHSRGHRQPRSRSTDVAVVPVGRATVPE
jgi:hypothetical protein